MLAIVLFLFFGIAVVITLAFKTLVARHIRNDVLRIVAIGLCFIIVLIGGAWVGMGALFAAIFYTPTTTRAITDDYYFTQQEYGFVTTSSSGYNLTFYRQRPFWLDQEIGKVQLECAGSEAIQATLTPMHNGSLRLRIAANNQERLDTILRLGTAFNFRRTFENRTIDFSNRR